MQRKKLIMFTILNLCLGSMYAMQMTQVNLVACLTPGERFQIRIESFDREISIIYSLPCQTLQDAEAVLSFLKKWEKHLNSITQDLQLASDDHRVKQRKDGIALYRQFYKQKYSLFQAARKKKKANSDKTSIDSPDDFLDTCIAENKKMVVQPKQVAKKPQRDPQLMQKFRDRKIYDQAIRGTNKKWARYRQEYPSDSEDELDG